MAPLDHPGYFIPSAHPDTNICLELKLKNYGKHPLHRLRATISGFNKNDIEISTKNSVEPVVTTSHEVSNPIPPEGGWTIRWIGEQLDSQDINATTRSMCDYFVLDFQYEDITLKNTFRNTYCWSVAYNSELQEVSIEEYEKLLSIIK